MKELVQFLARQLVNNPDAVDVKETQGDTASVLELRVAASAADPQFLRGLKEHRRARQLQFGTQARDHLVRRHVAFCERLQLNIHLSESARALN